MIALILLWLAFFVGVVFIFISGVWIGAKAGMKIEKDRCLKILEDARADGKKTQAP